MTDKVLTILVPTSYLQIGAQKKQNDKTTSLYCQNTRIGRSAGIITIVKLKNDKDQ